MKNLSTSTYLGLFVLTCILAAMVSIAVMQVVRTAEELGPKIYIVGGAIAFVGIMIPLMMVIMILRLQKGRD